MATPDEPEVQAAPEFPASTAAGQHMVYLITFSNQSDTTRTQIAGHLLDAYDSRDLKLKYYSVFQEEHLHGGTHFHCVVRCTRQHRWKQLAKFLRGRDLRPHFSTPGDYATAFHYCFTPSAKKPQSSLDPSPWVSEKHPIPGAIHVSTRLDTTPNKRMKVTALDMYDVIVANNLHSINDLRAYAKEQRASSPGLMTFCLQQPNLVSFVRNVWDMETAADKANRAKMTRLDILRQATMGPCTCAGQWSPAAVDILVRNGVHPSTLAHAIHQSLQVGARKFTNLYLLGPKNCGKSFLLRPLEDVYQCMFKPGGGGQYRLTDLMNCEVVLWQDWRFDRHIISWETLLLLGEGATFLVPLPQNTGVSGDGMYRRACPLFITSKSKMEHRDPTDTIMMDQRFNFIELTKSIPMESCRDIPSCSRCFANFVFRYQNLAEQSSHMSAFAK